MNAARALDGRAPAARSVASMSLPMALGLVLVGVFAFAALVLLSSYSDELRPDEPVPATATDPSAVGYSGLQSLLRELGHEVRVDPYAHRGEWNGRDLRLYFPTGAFSAKRRERIDGRVPGLLVLPKWAVVPVAEDSRDVIRRRNPGLSSTAERIVATLDDYHVVSGSRTVQAEWTLPETDRSVRISYPRWLSHTSRDEADDTDENSEPEDGTAEGSADSDADTLDDALRDAMDAVSRVALEELEEGPPSSTDIEALLHTVSINDSEFLVLAEPDLLSNHGIATQDRARTALSVLSLAARHYEIADPVFVFDDNLRRRDVSQNLVKLLTRPPFLAATLCLLAAGALIGWQGFNRFGDPDDADGEGASAGPRALAETAGQFIAGTGRVDALAPGYADVVRRQAVEGMGLSVWNRGRADAAIQARETLRDITPTLAAITADTSLSPMQRVRALQAWKQEIL